MRKQSSHLRWPLALLVLFLTASALGGCSTGGRVGASSWPGMTVDEDIAYIAFTAAVHAVDIQNGQEIWRFPSEPDQARLFYAPPALTADNQLVVGSYDGMVYILDASNGILIWSFDEAQGRIMGGPIVDGDHAYVPSADGSLYALDLTARNLAWSFSTEQPLWASPLVFEGTVYVASLDHEIYALDQETGNLLWSQEVSAAMAEAPVLAEGHLIVGTFGKGLLAGHCLLRRCSRCGLCCRSGVWRRALAPRPSAA